MLKSAGSIAKLSLVPSMTVGAQPGLSTEPRQSWRGPPDSTEPRPSWRGRPVLPNPDSHGGDHRTLPNPDSHGGDDRCYRTPTAMEGTTGLYRTPTVLEGTTGAPEPRQSWRGPPDSTEPRPSWRGRSPAKNEPPPARVRCPAESAVFFEDHDGRGGIAPFAAHMHAMAEGGHAVHGLARKAALQAQQARVEFMEIERGVEMLGLETRRLHRFLRRQAEP